MSSDQYAAEVEAAYAERDAQRGPTTGRDPFLQEHHALMSGHSDPEIAEYHAAEAAGLLDDDAMWSSYAAEPPAECYDASGRFIGDAGWAR